MEPLSLLRRQLPFQGSLALALPVPEASPLGEVAERSEVGGVYHTITDKFSNIKERTK